MSVDEGQALLLNLGALLYDSPTEASQRLHTALLVSIETSRIVDILGHKAQMTEELAVETGPATGTLLASGPPSKPEA